MKKEPWRYAVAAVSVIFIIYMWTQKNLAAVYAELPLEQLLPVVVTTLAVTIVKVAGIAAVAFAVKWLLKKLKR